MNSRFLVMAILMAALLVFPVPRAEAAAAPSGLLAAWAVTVIGAFVAGARTLQALGDAYEAACNAAGFEYHDRDEHNSRWHCTGLPRPERVSTG